MPIKQLSRCQITGQNYGHGGRKRKKHRDGLSIRRYAVPFNCLLKSVIIEKVFLKLVQNASK